MECRIARGKPEDFKCDALVSFQYQDEPVTAGLGKKLADMIRSSFASGNFKGANGELFQIFPLEGGGAKRMILVGIGKRSKLNQETIRKASGLAIRSLKRLKSVAYLELDNASENIVPLIDGAILGNYSFDRLKSDKEERKLQKISFFVGKSSVTEAWIKALQIINEGTLFARDLANLPANILNPEILAGEARKLGRKHKVAVKVLGEKQLKGLKMGSLLAVAQGSINKPRMVVWHYMGGKRSEPPIVLVGKGVTFDSGGISIKPSDGMEAMKGDMGGAGAVISMIPVLAQIKPKINVIGIAPLVENMPSGSAYRPGDVLTASNGKTIEVISTDAEGRLILADALVYAGKFDPKYVIDIATLTGACMVALGKNICAGIMGKDQELIDSLIEAGQQSGERLWQLPLWDDYAELIKSPAADMKNSGGRWAGAITAGLLLSYFAEGYPWAHLDIAGTDHEDGAHPYRYKGATGFGVRVLSRFILNEAGMFNQ